MSLPAPGPNLSSLLDPCSIHDPRVERRPEGDLPAPVLGKDYLLNLGEPQPCQKALARSQPVSLAGTRWLPAQETP